MNVGTLIDFLKYFPSTTEVRVMCEGEELPMRSDAPIVTLAYLGTLAPFVAINVTEHPQREGKHAHC